MPGGSPWSEPPAAALYEQVQQEITARINAAADVQPDAWRALRAGCHAFLECCTDPAVRRIVLLDAPAVLSWDAWRAVDIRYGLGSLKEGLSQAVLAGAVRVESLDAVAHLLLGAMNEAGMWIARAPDPDVALRDAAAALDGLLSGLRG